MKKILSLFVTIALLMVSFTGCPSMIDSIPVVDPSAQPESEPKHNVKLDYLKSVDLEYTVGEKLHLWIANEIGDHEFVGVTFVDANTGVALDVLYDIKYNEEHKNYSVYFTMPDADIILYKHIVESLSEGNSANCYYSDRLPDVKIKFAYVYPYRSSIPEEHKNAVKEVKGKWVYEITDWIDSSELCELVKKIAYETVNLKGQITYYFNYYTYFYVSDLVTVRGDYGDYTNLIILTESGVTDSLTLVKNTLGNSENTK